MKNIQILKRLLDNNLALQQILNVKKINVESFTERMISEFCEIGFHDDKYLISLVFNFLEKAEQFIETGINVGSTLNYVIDNFPNLKTYGCEPDKEAYNFAITKICLSENTHIYNQTSPEMLYEVVEKDNSILKRDTVFWLDAHGYGYKWPLKDEISFITHSFASAYIFIDDFKVPGLDYFGYDEYNGQICSFDYIEKSIKKDINFSLYYPAYKEKTSKHHPLRGWGAY